MDTTKSEVLAQAIDMMRRDGAADYEIEHFKRQFALAATGFDGYIRESEIEPVKDPQQFEALRSNGASEKQPKVASIKLNGGLGTTMGLNGPKSLLPVKDDSTFLSIVLQQLRHGNQGDQLLLMNSFNTHKKITETLAEVSVDNVSCFQQGRIPRLQEGSLTPLNEEAWHKAAWCPPGHGQLLDILRYGLAQRLIDQGMDYVFISNIDNLGATVDRAVVDHMAKNNLAWVSEVCKRGKTDIKGGHVAIRKSDGKLLVRDSNMTADEDMPTYRDIAYHQFFNTNNIWIDLRAILTLPADEAHDLPLIVNHKKIHNADDNASVIQLETGIGTGIRIFDNTEAIAVPRSRFIPVKDIPQWLLLRSDWFTVNEDGMVVEADPDNRPSIPAESIYQGPASETLEYYLSNPKEMQNILQ